MTIDNELIKKVLKGDRDCARVLIETNYTKVFQFLYGIVRNVTLAEDLTQETFLRVFEKLNMFDLQRSFQPWLFKIAYNVALKFLRKKSMGDVSSEVMRCLPSDKSTDFTLIDERMMLEECLEQIPFEERLMLLLKVVLDLTYEEIAEISGEPVGTVKTFVYRARIALRRKLFPSQFEVLSKGLEEEK